MAGPAGPTPMALRNELEDFYARYAEIVDEKQPHAWIDAFVADGVYAVGTHNNVSTAGSWWYTDRGLVSLKERAAFCCGYFWHTPTRTLLTVTNIRGQEGADGSIVAQAAFVLFAADLAESSQLHVVGRYRDRLVRGDGGLRFVEHRVVIEGETVPGNMGVLL